MQLSGLFRYPVKGLRGLALQSAQVEPCGLRGDRRWMVVDADGRFLSQRQLPQMARIDAFLNQAGPHDDALALGLGPDRIVVARPAVGAERIAVAVWRSRLEAPCPDPSADRWLSARLGVACRLVFLDDPQARPVPPPHGGPGDHVSFADGFPLLLTSAASLDALNDALPQPVGMDRFRPNLVVGGAAPWSEDRWRLLRIGGMLFRAPKACVRCVVTTIDQRSGEQPQPGEPLRTLRRLRRHPDGIVFGRNLIAQGAGRLTLGDPVEILE